MLTLDQKIVKFKIANWNLWFVTRTKIFIELSDKQSIKCCCGRLATGLHEQNCTKFNKKVDHVTFKYLLSQLKLKHKVEISRRQIKEGKCKSIKTKYLWK